MNTVRTDELDDDLFNNTEAPSGDQKLLILVRSDNMHLIGIFQGYCHFAGCKMKTLPCSNNVDIFFKTLKTEPPSMVFIDMEQAAQIFNSPEWPATWLFMQQKKIALCGIGKQPPNNNKTGPQSVFNKIFADPLNIDEIERFLDDRMAASTVSFERRVNERRRGDRRSKLVFFENKESSVSIPRHSYNRNLPNNLPDLGQSRCIGSLVIDYLAKSISVNGVSVEISPKEFQFIDLLAQQPGCVVKVEDIIKEVWPENKRATNADVHQYVYVLRNKFEENPHNPKLLLTVKGFGYRLCP